MVVKSLLLLLLVATCLACFTVVLGEPLNDAKNSLESSSCTCNNSESLKPAHSQEESRNNLYLLIQPFLWIFSLLWQIISIIFAFINIVLQPVFYVVRTFYNVFVYIPYSFLHQIFSTFYPLCVFCAVAAVLGTFVGGIAGWFSEVIVGVLTAPSVAPSKAQLAADQENKRRLARLKKRAAAAALARSRGRIPEEELYEQLNGKLSQGGSGFTTPRRTYGDVSGNASDASGYNSAGNRPFTPTSRGSYAGSVYGD